MPAPVGADILSQLRAGTADAGSRKDAERNRESHPVGLPGGPIEFGREIDLHYEPSVLNVRGIVAPPGSEFPRIQWRSVNETSETDSVLSGLGCRRQYRRPCGRGQEKSRADGLRLRDRPALVVRELGYRQRHRRPDRHQPREGRHAFGDRTQEAGRSPAGAEFLELGPRQPHQRGQDRQGARGERDRRRVDHAVRPRRQVDEPRRHRGQTRLLGSRQGRQEGRQGNGGH